MATQHRVPIAKKVRRTSGSDRGTHPYAPFGAAFMIRGWLEHVREEGYPSALAGGSPPEDDVHDLPLLVGDLAESEEIFLQHMVIIANDAKEVYALIHRSFP